MYMIVESDDNNRPLYISDSYDNVCRFIDANWRKYWMDIIIFPA